MDFSKPIEIAPDIFWVGYVIPNDPFQCHVYLIKDGNESILIDPGSMITFPTVLEKITSIIPLRDIKYIIMHHQDPDIVGCYTTLEKIMPHKEKYIITHWRSEMLLKHYVWETPFWLIDSHDWKLKTQNRELEFVFTPYAHFPGAFCTYDKKSGILFSSDLFGGLTEEFNLFAKDVESYFEAAKPFHKHYMPSQEVLHHALNQVQKTNPCMIAPQHGSIIKKDLINPLIEKLKDIDCGLYLLDNYETDLLILDKADEILQHFFKDTVSLSSFEIILKNLFENIKKVLPSIEKIEICGNSPLSGFKQCFSFSLNQEITTIEHVDLDYSFKQELFQKGQKIGEVFVNINKDLNKHEKNLLHILLNKISIPIAISLEKELVLRELELKNRRLYHEAITDSLTQLYNRSYMEDNLEKKLKEAQRYKFPICVAMLDIDFFKKINDTYGHVLGDCVLKELAEILKNHFRDSDIVTRYGGEEFFIIMPFIKEKEGYHKLDTFRKNIEKISFCQHQKIHITISGGIYECNFDEPIKTIIEQADKRLYKAKENGRNQIVYK